MSDIMTEDKHDLMAEWGRDTGNWASHDRNFPHCNCNSPLINSVNSMLDAQRDVMAGFITPDGRITDKGISEAMNDD